MSREFAVDIETLSTRADAVIMSIGACRIDTAANTMGETFENYVTLESCIQLGMRIDPSTLRWWATQPDEARNVFERTHEDIDGVTIAGALANFTRFLLGEAEFLTWNGEPVDDIVIWGNGSDFDNAILQDAFARVGLTCPWKFWGNRDLRTLRGVTELVTGLPAPKFKPATAH